jgi:hypothetical protein
VDITQGAVFTGGNKFIAKIIGAGNVARGQVYFIVLVDVKDSFAVFYLLKAFAVTVIARSWRGFKYVQPTAS